MVGSTATGRNLHWPQYRRGWQLTPHCRGPCGTLGSMEDCRNVIEIVGRAADDRENLQLFHNSHFTIIVNFPAIIQVGLDTSG